MKKFSPKILLNIFFNDNTIIIIIIIVKLLYIFFFEHWQLIQTNLEKLIFFWWTRQVKDQNLLSVTTSVKLKETLSLVF